MSCVLWNVKCMRVICHMKFIFDICMFDIWSTVICHTKCICHEIWNIFIWNVKYVWFLIIFLLFATYLIFDMKYEIWEILLSWEHWKWKLCVIFDMKNQIYVIFDMKSVCDKHMYTSHVMWTVYVMKVHVICNMWYGLCM